MLGKAAARAAWVGRTASMVFGLALVLALVFGAATIALGANGSTFVLGTINNTATALTKLTANVQGPAMQVQNTNPGADDNALSLSVQPGEAPMRVNSDARVPALNADYVDGRSFSCPAGTLFHEGACIERAARATAAYDNASTDCLDEGRRLPTVAELQTFRNRSGQDFGISELTSEKDLDTDRFVWIVQSNNGATVPTLIGALWPYRCVVPPS